MPSLATTTLLYNGKVKVIFDPSKRPRYKVCVRRHWVNPAPHSVSEIANTADKSFVLMPWAKKVTRQHFTQTIVNDFPDSLIERHTVLAVFSEALERPETEKKEAGGIGNAVHEFLHLFARSKIDNTPPPELPSDKKVRKCILGFLAWYKAHKVKFIEAERVVYSIEHGYVGTLDVVARVDGILTLIDYKTCNILYPSFVIQVAGYWKAMVEEGMKIKKAVILQFDKNQGLHRSVVLKSLKEIWPSFEHALRFRREERIIRKLVTK